MHETISNTIGVPLKEKEMYSVLNSLVDITREINQTVAELKNSLSDVTRGTDLDESEECAARPSRYETKLPNNFDNTIDGLRESNRKLVDLIKNLEV